MQILNWTQVFAFGRNEYGTSQVIISGENEIQRMQRIRNPGAQIRHQCQVVASLLSVEEIIQVRQNGLDRMFRI